LNGLQGKIHLDFRSSEPITLQIVRQIETLVRQGGLKQGDQLPTVRELATELRINFSTVARAYKILDEEGLISTQRGRGTYIWEQAEPETAFKLRQRSLEELARHYLEETSRLGCSQEEARQVLEAVIRMAQANGDEESS
jgi:GntR family transcriptional regulator